MTCLDIHANPRKHLTLAQQIGIEQPPPSPLSQQEWNSVHRQSRKRNDVKYGCSICCEDFKLKRQVLLSCSHTFHYQCLLSFERHSQTLCCPLCRTTNYEKHTVHDGQEYWREKCFRLIQNTWRSFVCLREYRKMQETIEPKSPRKKEKFYLRKFQRMNQNLISVVQQRSDDIDVFLSSIDNSIAQSRVVFNSMDDADMAELDEKEEVRQTPKTCRDGRLWSEIKEIAMKREEKDCSICMELLAEKTCVLLSCTHVFHQDCIQSFERFSLNAMAVCPICREEEYDKLEILYHAPAINNNPNSQQWPNDQ